MGLEFFWFSFCIFVTFASTTFYFYFLFYSIFSGNLMCKAHVCEAGFKGLLA